MGNGLKKHTKAILQPRIDCGLRERPKTSASEASLIQAIQATTNLDLIKSVDLKKAKKDKEKPNYTSVCFLTDGRVVAIDQVNRKCILWSDTLEPIGKPYKFSAEPHTVVPISDDKVAVTVGHSKQICILKICKMNKIKLKRRLSTSFEPFSISLMDRSTFVVSTMNDKRPVLMKSFAGKESQFVDIEFPKKSYGYDCSQCTYVQDSDALVLTDRFTDTVHVYWLKTGETNALKDPRIKEPRGACEGPYGSIFVCSEKTNSIVHITNSGRIVATYKVDMIFPYAVNVSHDMNKLVVSNECYGQEKLQLYMINMH